MKKKKAPAALGPAQKNAVLMLKHTHFITKNVFYKKKKAPAALGPAQKKQS